MSFPRVPGPPVVLPLLPGLESNLWTTLIELGQVFPDHWTLIGGQMVLLHGLEHGRTPPRVSADLDALVNARLRAIPQFVEDLEAMGFGLEGISNDGRAHRYRRNDVVLDVLAPEGLGRRVDLTTTPPGHTIEVPGGSQALSRTELLSVSFEGQIGEVPRPSLLAAIVAKAAAAGIGDKRDIHTNDLAFLLSLVKDPVIFSAELSRKDRQRLRGRRELLDEGHTAWRSLGSEHADAALTAFRLLLA